MPLDPESLFKPIRKLRKLVNKFHGVPSPEQVHSLRTNCRRLEAIVYALKCDGKKRGRRLLEAVKPIRKKAGQVRDMDVLTGLVISIPKAKENEACIRLLEHLGARRFQLIRRLKQTVEIGRRQARSYLKQFAGYLNKGLRISQPNNQRRSGLTDPAALVLELSSSLAAWPRLDARNLHPYRLKVKELRYVLELASDPEKAMIDALGDVKDSIGEWHDWCELETIALDVIGEDRHTRQQIHSIAEERRRRAISIATHTHTKHFAPASQQDRKHRAEPASLKRSVLAAAGKVSA